MKKQVCVKIERYYDIEATTQEDIISLMKELAKVLGKNFMLATELEKGAVCPSANCAFVTSEVVNEEDTTHRVIVCTQE